jgi:alanine racemase
MRIRLRDVAERAGVSEATASRVVNDKPGVNDATRNRVRRVVDELGYELKGLRVRLDAGLVGLIVPELENPIFPAFAQTIETGLARRGYTSVLCTATQDGVQEPGYIDLLLERGVTGIIVVSGLNANTQGNHDVYRRLLARGMPMVFLNGFVDDLDATFVSCDDRYAASLAVRHLLSLGHRRLGFVTGPHRYLPVQRKLTGLREALAAELGAADGPLVAESLFGVEGGHAAAVELLEEGCTALICASDLMALGALRTVAERGASVPEDVSVVGYDDTPLMAFVNPPLTTVAQPVRAMSDAAVRSLLERIGGTPPRRREYLFRPELVVRGSTGVAQATAATGVR